MSYPGKQNNDYNFGYNFEIPSGGLSSTAFVNGRLKVPSQAQLDNTTSVDYNDFATKYGNQQLSNELQGAQLKSLNLANDYATGANAMQWKDVKGVGDFGSWLTDNRGGGSNYLDTGLKGLGTAATLYSAYNDNKYKNKMAGIAQQAQDLQAKQYALYEQQINKQNAKSDAAQAAYDKAQTMTT
jgi:hypothetical protein